MSSRTLRVVLLLAAFGAVLAGSYVVFSSERALARSSTSGGTFAAQAGAALTELSALRTAQQAYVAAGQGSDYWMTQATERLASLDRAVSDLAAAASTDTTRSATQAAARALEQFRKLDGRARQYVRNGQVLMASDVIFTESLAALSGAAEQLEAARLHEETAGASEADRLRARQLYAGCGAIAVLLLVVLLLVPIPQPEVDVLSAMRALTEAPAPKAHPAAAGAAPRARTSEWFGDEESAARVITRTPESPAPAPPPDPMFAPVPSPAPAEPRVDLSAAARVCADMARVLDAGDIPALLSRAADLLDARGLIVWVADRAGSVLYPLFTHGYASQVVIRMGGIPGDADNATAAAWRSGESRAIGASSDAVSALVIPIITAEGCVGVLAAELSAGQESREDIRALSTIFAAQLATVVTPLEAEVSGEQPHVAEA